MKLSFKDIIFWVILILALALLLWNVFGNSPTEFITIISIIFMVVLKMWSISDAQIKTDINVRNSFNKIRDEIKFIKDDVTVIKYDITLIKKKFKII